MTDCQLQVIQEMFDKAFTSSTMDYELIFWGYTFAIKKITWFAQVIYIYITASGGDMFLFHLNYHGYHHYPGYRRVFCLHNRGQEAAPAAKCRPDVQHQVRQILPGQGGQPARADEELLCVRHQAPDRHRDARRGSNIEVESVFPDTLGQQCGGGRVY